MKSVAEILEGLGGSAAVATALELPYTTVASWKARGSVPSAYWSPLIALARARKLVGVTLSSLTAIAAANAPARRARQRAA